MTLRRDRVRARMLAVVLASALLAGGCATNGDPRDPLEPMNRAIYKFNDGVDHLLVRPAAELYQGRMIPQFVRTGLRNFFSNINDVIVFLNDLLQGKLDRAETDLGRIVINTTAGVLGFVDVAADEGLIKNNEDFGQTLGVWGFEDGPYLVLPFFGPSNVRDTVGFVGDAYMWPVSYINPHSTRNAIIALRYVGLRADLLAATTVLEAAALDPYTFTRDAYLQRRRNLLYDGNPPPEKDELEPEPKPGTPSSRVAPPYVVSFDGSYSLAPALPNGAQSSALGLKPDLDTADLFPAPTAMAESSRQPHVVRVWLPSPRQLP